jgi:hypothetical protein
VACTPVVESTGGFSVFGATFTWEAVEATAQIASVLLAIVTAFIALQTALQTLREQRRLRATEARSIYYRKLIADPVMERVDHFVEGALNRIETAAYEIRTLANDGSRYEVQRKALKSHVAEFARLQVTMMGDVTRRLQLWKDMDLVQPARLACEAIQDQVSVQFPKLLGPPHDPEPIRSVLQDRSADLLSLLVEADPDAGASDEIGAR